MSPDATRCPKFDVLRRQLALVDAGAKFFSNLFDRAPDPMIVIDATGRVLAANAAASRLYAVDHGELLNLRLQDLLPSGLDVSKAARRLRDYGETSLEFSESSRDGGLSEMRVEARLFQAGRYVVTFRDVTREKRFERELEHAHEQRTFGEAAAAVVHDVNNLLVPIFSYTDLLAQREPADGELQRSVAEIREAAERAALLARKLLSIAELTTERPAVVQMNDMLLQMKPMLTRLLGDRIELSLRFDRELGHIEIDRERLERLVLNLVINARDAMPNAGTLVVETIRELRDAPTRRALGASGATAYAVLCVTDTGAGMDAATRARIFEPFFTTKSSQGGTGLGLSMVHSFVTRNGGFIDVDSQPGCGTTFRVGFPALAGPR
ncbi:MAG TPA: ATP-binding protein [Polyangiaceae bacterium]|nr:ATP-binding protein [Polyangiaceae bacterium]